jgi:hypothetical protein
MFSMLELALACVAWKGMGIGFTVLDGRPTVADW